MNFIKFKKIFTYYFFILILPLNIFAESQLSLCNGVWTSKPCENPEKSFIGTNRPNEKIITKEENQKKPKDIASILHPLTMKVLNLKEKYQKEFDISNAKTICENVNSSLNDCRDAVNLEHEKIRDYELKLEELALKEKEIDEKNKEPKEPATQNIINVTQIQNRTEIKVKPEPEINKLKNPAR